MRRLAQMLGVAFFVGAVLVIGRLGRDWEARVAVRGHSMAPTLRAGDWLLVDPGAYERRAPRLGELVVARDPRQRGRVVVKRVIEDGNRLLLGSDHPAHEEDRIGPVAAADVLGRPWFRYWPTEGLGPIR